MNNKQLQKDILNLWKDKDPKLAFKLNYIAKELNIISEDDSKYDPLKDALSNLINQGKIKKLARRKYSLNDDSETYEFTGTLFFNHKKAYIETNHILVKKIYIKKNYLNTALAGDIVKVVLHALPRKATKINHRGEVVEIIERSKASITGIMDFDGSFHFLVPDDTNYYVDFLIPIDKLNGAKHGDKVSSQIIHWDDPMKSPLSEVLEVIGTGRDMLVEFSAIVREFDLMEIFPKLVDEEANKIKAPQNRKIKSRLDLRENLIITIDPDDAKDFDDALSLDILPNGNFRLGVHIADVAHYVTEGSEIDKEAVKRGNSTYLVDRVVPMLPEHLSNDICSLKPDVIRNAMTVFMEINSKGKLENYEIADSIIKSKRRYTYNEALDIINTGKGDNTELILNLHKLALVLKEKRIGGGGFEFESTEYKFKFDKNNYPIEAIAKQGNEATSLVEECMLLCNKTVAEHVNKISKELHTHLPFIYRVHDSPDKQKLKEAFNFISSLDSTISKGIISNLDISAVLKLFKDRPEKATVHQVIIRSMAKAVYTDNNIGHFGLGFNDYTHFTSPIRRYPDLIVHRLIKLYNSGKKASAQIANYKEILRSLAYHFSETERNAMIAERASVKLALTIIANENVGNIFTGKVSGVARHGLYITVDKIYCEGLLHIKDLWDDYYFYDEDRMLLEGRHTKKVYSFGSTIQVRIVKANIDRRQIDFEMIED